MKRICLLIPILALAAAAATIDGKWVAELEMRGRNTEAQKVEMTLDLKSEGSELKGAVIMKTPRGNREQPISEGKVDGDKFSFTTMQKARNGEVKIKWTGTVRGDELSGERAREGGRRGVPFTAKRSS